MGSNLAAEDHRYSIAPAFFGAPMETSSSLPALTLHPTWKSRKAALTTC